MKMKQSSFDMNYKFIDKMNSVIDTLVDTCIILSIMCLVINIFK